MPGQRNRLLALLVAALLFLPGPIQAKRRSERSRYTVRKGDTLWSIARSCGVPFDSLRKANNIQNPDVIRAGQVLRIPVNGSRSRKTAAAPQSPRPKNAPGFHWPLKGKITSRFGPRRGRLHAGIDIATPEGIIITASAGGKVVRAGGGWRRYGKVVLIDHGDGYSTLYAHCSRVFVRAGQVIRKRQAIAAVGATGNATGPHLHFEIWMDGKTIDPEIFFDRRPQGTKIAQKIDGN